jgi:FSR family fosmidomycin resistance protein-like MFS transporter
MGAAALGKARFGTAVVLTVSGGHLVHDLYTSFLAPLLPLLMDKFALTATMAGALGLFLNLPSALNPLLGLLAERWELKLLAAAAPAVSATAMTLLGLAPSYSILALLLVTTGISAAFWHLLGPVLIARTAGEGVGRGMGLWMTAGELARTLGPLAAVGAVTLFGLERMWPVMAVGLASSLLLYLQLRNLSTASGTSQERSLSSGWRILKGLMLPLAGVQVSQVFMVYSLMLYLPTFMVRQGRGLWLSGASLALLELSGVMGALTAGSLSDRLGRRKIIITAMSTAPVLLFLFSRSSGWSQAPLLILLGFFVFAASPALLAMVQENCGGRRTLANGLFMGFNFGFGALASVTIGRLVDSLGFVPAYGICALIGLVGLVFIPVLPRDKKR